MSKTAEELMAETAARRPKTGTQQRREQEARVAAVAKGLSMDADTDTNRKETAVSPSKSTKSAPAPQAAVVAKAPAKAPATVVAPAPATVAPDDMELIYTPTNRTLKTLEGVIQKGLESYVKAGNALREINERKLFTEATNPETGEKFTSFEAYVKVRWDMTKQRAHQIIDASKTVATLVTHGAKYLPSGEFATRQIADVAKADPAKAVEIVNKTGDASPTGKVTAKGLAETRQVVAPQRATAGGSGGSSTRTTVTFKGSGVTRKSGVALGSTSTSVDARPKSDAERNRAADLKNLNDLLVALREGLLDTKDDDIRARVQRVAGLALTWLAGEWDGKPGHAKLLIIPIGTAKVISEKLLAAQAEARLARQADEARAQITQPAQQAAVAKNRATVAQVAAEKTVVVEAEPAEAKTEQQVSDEEWAMGVLRDPNAGAVHQRIAREILGMPATGGAMNMAAAPEVEEDEADEDETDEVEEEEVEDSDEAEAEDDEDDEAEDDEEEFDFDVEEAPAPAPAPAPRSGRQVAARRR